MIRPAFRRFVTTAFQHGVLAKSSVVYYRATVNLTEVFEEVVHLVGQDERLTIAQEAYLFLAPPQEVTEINVEKGACRLVKHVVPWVSIANS